jgi:hypothetical protein
MEWCFNWFRKFKELNKISIDIYFTSPKFFDDLQHRKINACGTVHHNRKEML